MKIVSKENRLKQRQLLPNLDPTSYGFTAAPQEGVFGVCVVICSLADGLWGKPSILAVLTNGS
jgi:hypothetical protein